MQMMDRRNCDDRWGMNQDTSKLVRTAGADILVAGTFLFGHESISSAKDLLLGANA